MIVGSVRNGLPWIPITLEVAAAQHSVFPGPVEFVLDTGFEGELAMPERLVSHIEAARFVRDDVFALADGSRRYCPVYELDIEWDGARRLVDVLALDGNPLAGTELMNGCHLTIDFRDGGEVSIELP